MWESVLYRCFAAYKNAKKTGCPHCKNLVTQQTHKNKVVSLETRAKISEKAKTRPGSLTGVTGESHPRFKGGYGRDFSNPSNADYGWLNGVRKMCKGSCVLTGEKRNLVAHHLDDWNLFPEKRYDVTNGVLIKKEIHKQFHDTYGYGNNTEDQFAEFCETNFDIDWFALKKKIIGE